ncbi:C1 family peptidase [Cutibacterium avidum]|uniref:aminopeptidase C n=1 Tax=Cutibacterium avidum TaxID=33010 RepID=UPI001DAE5015|nr:C1 family peptidase [Cutibacterium avidum]MBS6260508.1 C1 family peptidase [Propionibacterium sp.]MCO6662200.1 C1 family peptidase [Cutibacterium avidum]MCO6679327.1 C1 family peptidase [Cutibacterium avidum]MCO6681993.1 C1 family peptidase [Cutibacterium avidum]MCO6685093.1 C1 family peptidase [Cutibacterium avidum]
MSEPFVLDASFSASRAESFAHDATGRLVQNAVTGTGADTVSLDRTVVNGIDETTSERLDSWKVTDQKHSGRCWEFAGLNVLRAKVIDELKVDDLEFSQNYIAFFDKLEKANHTLARAIATASRDADEEEVRAIMDNPAEDGGWWMQFTDLVAKYGVVPSWVMPDTESAGNTLQMNRALSTVLRRAIGKIRDAATNSDANEGASQMEAARSEALSAVWRILAIHLGTPPTSFTWQYRDKDKNFHRKGTYTPLEFAHEIVPQAFEPWVSLGHDPREEHPVGRTYVHEHTPYMEGGTPYWHLSVELDVMKKAVIDSIAAGEPVWFACDVKKQFDKDLGIWDAKLHDYEALYGIDMEMSKAERLRLRESGGTHAMTVVGVDLVDGVPVRWRVENSWGDEVGRKGFFTMNDSWFDEYVYNVIVPRSRVSEEIAKACDQEPIVLPEHDMM